MQALVTCGLLGFSNDAFVRSGQVADSLDVAVKALSAATSIGGSGTRIETVALADVSQQCGQLLVLLARSADAVDQFEQCLKHVSRTDKPDRQARSCLISAIQCYERSQFRTAWDCLKRILDVKGVSPQILVEACAAMAALLFKLGMRRPAQTAVLRSRELLRDTGQAHATPHAILQVLQVEFRVLDKLRQHPRLDDLVFWPQHDEVARRVDDTAQAVASIATCRAEVAGFRLLTQRLDFLEQLLQIAYFGAKTIDKALAHIAGMNAQGLQSYCDSARHDLALACVAAGQADWLRRLLNAHDGSSRATAAAQGNFEHGYCQAKLGEFVGSNDGYIVHYRAYAKLAVTHVRRTCAYITVPNAFRQSGTDIVRDDIASRLPSRYRRAYQFILSNLQRPDLSVHDVAESIGVTERALQLAFRMHIGLSPSEVIRQRRMSGIRDELNEGAAIYGATMLDVARRWGVNSRSSFSSAYQAAFGESPRQTDCGSR